LSEPIPGRSLKRRCSFRLKAGLRPGRPSFVPRWPDGLPAGGRWCVTRPVRRR